MHCESLSLAKRVERVAVLPSRRCFGRRLPDGNACTTRELRGVAIGAILAQIRRNRRICNGESVPLLGALQPESDPRDTFVEETKQFPEVERRRNPGLPADRRQAGEVAVFQELGKALTSSLQLDQVLRTIMEKIDEFLRPDNWSLLLLDEAKQELYF